jgi:hypothetical protein
MKVETPFTEKVPDPSIVPEVSVRGVSEKRVAGGGKMTADLMIPAA